MQAIHAVWLFEQAARGSLFLWNRGIMHIKTMVVTISAEDLVWMQAALLDEDREEALKIVKELVKRLQIQAGKGLKSHLDS